MFARSRDNGGRSVHVLGVDSRSTVRAASRHLQRRRASQSRGVETSGSDCGPHRHYRDADRTAMNLTLGFSPCPNDCFIFDALVHKRIDLEGLEFTVSLADVEALN